MKNVFLDSSVLVAACASKTGASAFILGYSRQGKIRTYVSGDVVEEARKNIHLKVGRVGLERFLHYIKFANMNFIPYVSAEKIAECKQQINKKDAPILAAALESPASFLITLDKKHFLQPKVIQYAKPKIIITSGEFILNYLRK